MFKKLIIPVLLSLSSCIGTDIVEEITIEEKLEITGKVEVLKIGESYQFMADYFDEKGMKMDVPIVWASSDESVIAINSKGGALAKKEGSVYISAAYGELKDSVIVEAGRETVLQPDVRKGEFQGRNKYLNYKY